MSVAVLVNNAEALLLASERTAGAWRSGRGGRGIHGRVIVDGFPDREVSKRLRFGFRRLWERPRLLPSTVGHAMQHLTCSGEANLGTQAGLDDGRCRGAWGGVGVAAARLGGDWGHVEWGIGRDEKPRLRQ